MNAPAQLRTECELLQQIIADFDADIPWTYTLNATFIAEARALLAVERKPFCFVRTVNGEIDWGENCLGEDESIADPDEGYAATPLFLAPPQQEWLDPELLGDILELLQDQYDTRDGEDGRPLPNQAMRLGGELEQALAKRYNRPPAGEKS